MERLAKGLGLFLLGGILVFEITNWSMKSDKCCSGDSLESKGFVPKLGILGLATNTKERLVEVRRIKPSFMYTGVTYKFYTSHFYPAPISWSRSRSHYRTLPNRTETEMFFVERNGSVWPEYVPGGKYHERGLFMFVSGPWSKDNYVLLNLGKVDMMVCRETIIDTTPIDKLIGFKSLNLTSPPGNCLWYSEQRINFSTDKFDKLFLLRNMANTKEVATFEDNDSNITEMRLMESNRSREEQELRYEVLPWSNLKGVILSLHYNKDSIPRKGSKNVQRIHSEVRNNDSAPLTKNLVLFHPLKGKCVNLAFSFMWKAFSSISFEGGQKWNRNEKELSGNYDFRNSTSIEIPLEDVRVEINVTCPPKTTCVVTSLLTLFERVESRFHANVKATAEMMRVKIVDRDGEQLLQPVTEKITGEFLGPYVNRIVRRVSQWNLFGCTSSIWLWCI